MNVKLLYVLSPCVLLALLSCGLLDSDGKDTVDLRKLTWTVDTLAYPESSQTAMSNIWGSSSSNVYVVGHNSRNRGHMWHFDGNEWTDVPLSTTQGGNIAGPISVNDIYGFAADDIWAVGAHKSNNPDPPPTYLRSALLIHFDGQEWNEVDLTGPGLHEIWGPSPDDIYAVGIAGAVFHYDGESWSAEYLPDTVQCNHVGGDAKDVFIMGSYRPGGLLGYRYMYHNSGSGWELLDSQDGYTFAFYPRFGTTIFSPEPGYIYSSNTSIFRWDGSGWNEFFSSDTFMTVGGASHDNLIAVGQFGLSNHWNGVDWQTLVIPRKKMPEDVWLQDVWTDGEEVFICGHDANGHQSYIIHGQ